MRLEIPPKVTQIIETLSGQGHEAFAVGGCIRDTILGRTPDDWDITTSARPGEVKALFHRTVDTGLQHGTVTVLLGQESFEVTTYRIDGDYADHRHPDAVVYADRLAEDLQRRDFTINAMAYNEERGLVDLFGGMEDLDRRIIRCVGDPAERFSEDALRILRAVRFSAQLGFSIEASTQEALGRLAPTLVHVSAERIQTELVKLLVSPHPHYVKLLEDTGILPVILPELPGISPETLAHLQEVPPDRVLRLAVLCLPLGEEGAKKLLRRLKFDNACLLAVSRLVRWYRLDMAPTPEGMRRGLREVGEELMDPLLTLQQHRHPVEEYRRLWEEIREKGQCFTLGQLAVTGSDLIALGIPPGREMGVLLQRCLDEVIRRPEHNRREFLETYALGLRDPGK